MLCQLSSLYPLSALDWTLSHLSAISPHADRLTDDRSLTQSLGTATFLTSLEFIHARTPLAPTYSPATFTWMSPCVTRIHCYPGYLAIMTPDPGPFCDHSQRLPMVLTSHGVTTHCGSLTHFQRTCLHLNDYRVDRTSYNSHLSAWGLSPSQEEVTTVCSLQNKLTHSLATSQASRYHSSLCNVLRLSDIEAIQYLLSTISDIQWAWGFLQTPAYCLFLG